MLYASAVRQKELKIVYDDNYLQETLRHAFDDPENYNAPKGVRRHDFSNVHGWWVRVSRDKTMFRKLFSDGVHGSIQDSFKQAILYRHEVLASFPVTIKKISNRGLSPDPEKRIKRYENKGRLRPYIFWQARWYNKEHEIKKENFPIYTHGEERAKLMALEAARINHNKKPKISDVADPYLIPQYEAYSRADVEIWATIKNTIPPSNQNKNEETSDYEAFGFEGERKYELHKSIERDRKLRNKKVALFLEENEKLFCELCLFSFLDAYPFLSTDIIEVHHITPLSSLTKNTKVKLDDLMLLCSNCHFAVHQGDSEDNLLNAMIYFENTEARIKN